MDRERRIARYARKHESIRGGTDWPVLSGTFFFLVILVLTCLICAAVVS